MPSLVLHLGNESLSMSLMSSIVETIGVKLTLVQEESGDRPTPVFQQLLADGVWSRLVCNVGALQGHVERIGESARNRFAEVDDSLNAFEYKLSLLKTLLGDRSNAQGTSTVFMLLENLASQAPSGTPTPIQVMVADIRKAQEFKDLVMVVQGLDLELKRFKATITGMVHGESKHSFDQTFFDPHCAFQTNLVQPTIGFLRTWSSSAGTPADNLSAALQNLDQAVQRLSLGRAPCNSYAPRLCYRFPAQCSWVWLGEQPAWRSWGRWHTAWPCCTSGSKSRCCGFNT
ncbi:hypothetical protein ACA910_003527 [Epithemia clementina (nom. ined.)]